MTAPRRQVTAAYTAFVCALAYGAMKLDWALGGDILMRQSPLPRSARDDLLDRTTGTVVQHWASAALAAVGAMAALQLAGRFRPPGKAGRRLLLTGAWAGCAFMTARALGALGYGIVNDLRLLTGLASAPLPDADPAPVQARWDLLLWSQYWLLFGACWGIAAWHYQRQDRSDRISRAPGLPAGSLNE